MSSITTENKGGLIEQSLNWLKQSLFAQQSAGGYFEPLMQSLWPQWRADKILSQVQALRPESGDMYTLILKPGRRFKPFVAGQFIELIVEKDGSYVSRFFSISSSPAYFKQKGLIEISIRIQQDGNITPWLPKALAHGGVVNISQAQGDFCLPNQPFAQGQQDTLFIAGGSGITPFRSMIQQLAKQDNQHESGQITLMYFARSEEHFLFKQELLQYSQDLAQFDLQLINGEQAGYFSMQQLQQHCPDFLQRQVYVCGPSPMILLAKDILLKNGLAQSQLHYEFFGPEPTAAAKADAGHILFKRSGKQIEVVKDQGETLLQLAESQNLTPVTGCRIGVCHQCICKKQSGVVYNQKTGQYSDTGEQEIQLCISQPVGDVVLDL